MNMLLCACLCADMGGLVGLQGVWVCVTQQYVRRGMGVSRSQGSAPVGYVTCLWVRYCFVVLFAEEAFGPLHSVVGFVRESVVPAACLRGHV